MSKKTIIVHCLHGLRKPILYARRGYAQLKCAKQPGHQIILCNNEEQAHQLFNIKKEEYQRTLKQNKMQILKSFIEKVKTPAFTKNAIPEQSKYISVRERQNREKIVNGLFLKYKVLPAPAFHSTPFLVSPLIEYEGYFDGASRGNPGISSIGCVLQYLQTVLMTRSELLGTLTNNQSELTALGFLLAESYCNGVQHLRVMGDSKLAIEFMKNNFEVRHPNILPLFECNQILAKYFQSICYIKISRDDNKEADRLANEAYLKLHGGRVERWR